MTRDEQLGFVQQLISAVQGEVCTNILAGRIPEEWDGHELREYLADKFADCRSRLMTEKCSRRRRAYRNEVIVRDL